MCHRCLMLRAIVAGLLIATFLLSPVGLSRLEAAVFGGTIDSVAPGQQSLVIKLGTGDKTQTVRLDPAVKITLDGKPAALADLQPGHRASVFTTNELATRITARSEAAPSPTPRTVTPKEKPTKPTDRSAASASNAAHPWPQFRGPNRDNISHETGLLKSWPADGPRLLWTATGLGEGYSSVSVAGGLVLTMGNQGNQESILAVDLKTGKPVWAAPTGKAYQESRGNGPRSVPTVDGSRVYALGANGDLACVELESGKVHWQGNILQQFNARNLKWGICESVLIDGDQLICTPGGSAATMVALNKQTGRITWSAVSPSGEQAGYSSAITTTVGGVRQYVQFTAEGTIGVRAQDGAMMWKDTGAANSTANCSMPVLFNDCVFSASGYSQGGAMVRLASSRGTTACQRAYQTKDMKNHHGGMVVLDGHIYGSNDPGVLVCMDFMTGNVVWQDRSVGKGSLTYADGNLIVRGENGRLALVEATPKGYNELSRFEQPQRSDKPAWPYPVVADGKLFLRDMDTLLCFDLENSNN